MSDRYSVFVSFTYRFRKALVFPVYLIHAQIWSTPNREDSEVEGPGRNPSSEVEFHKCHQLHSYFTSPLGEASPYRGGEMSSMASFGTQNHI